MTATSPENPARIGFVEMSNQKNQMEIERYQGLMDVECVALCDALNGVPGVRTISSCCGHGREPYRIWVTVESLEALPPMLYWFDGCHCGHYGWRVLARTDCAMGPAVFRIEGPIGAYAQAGEIAELINDAGDPSEYQKDPTEYQSP